MATIPEPEHAHFSPEEATGHVLVYVDWEVIRSWKRQETSRAAAAGKAVRRQLPYVYASGNTTFRAYVRPGTVIWVWTCPEYAETPRVHRLPPSLVARLHVIDAVPWKPLDDPARSPRIPAWFPKRWSWVGLACPGCSTYLPVNNVYPHLEKLTSRDRKNEERPVVPGGGLTFSEDHSPYTSLPSKVRFPKRLGERGLEGLMAHARAVESRRTVFVSYCRREDRNNFTGSVVEALTAHELAPWLDMQAIPDRVATGNLHVDEAILEQIFSDGIRQARAFVALVGPAYKESRYAMEEWQMARQAATDDPGFVRAQVSLDGCRIEEPGAPAPIPAGTPGRTAEAITEAVVGVPAT